MLNPFFSDGRAVVLELLAILSSGISSEVLIFPKLIDVKELQFKNMFSILVIFCESNLDKSIDIIFDKLLNMFLELFIGKFHFKYILFRVSFNSYNDLLLIVTL